MIQILSPPLVVIPIRYEMDCRNSANVAPDFYEMVTELFNDPNFVPTSLCYPYLHDDFTESEELPVNPEYTMTVERAKAMITLMKPRIAQIQSNYEQSGNGDGMRRGDSDDDEEADSGFDLNDCMEGSN